MVGKPKAEYPSTVILDNQLEMDQNHPTIWVNPKQAEVGPLRDKVEGQESRGWLARKNGFFRALRAWRPTHELGALGLDTKFKLEYILDKENGNQYVHTVLHLSDGDEAYAPSSLIRRPVPDHHQSGAVVPVGHQPDQRQPGTRGAYGGRHDRRDGDGGAGGVLEFGCGRMVPRGGRGRGGVEVHRLVRVAVHLFIRVAVQIPISEDVVCTGGTEVVEVVAIMEIVAIMVIVAIMEH